MPVYLYTIHAYRSWNADNPRGYVQRGKGSLPPDTAVAKAYTQAATEPAVLFGQQEQETLRRIAIDVCQRRDWKLHALACETSHVHLLVSWNDETDRIEVFRKLKNLMSRELNLASQTKRKHWFSRSGSKRRVRDREHFEYLMQTYLPKHRGLVWREGEDPP